MVAHVESPWTSRSLHFFLGASLGVARSGCGTARACEWIFFTDKFGWVFQFPVRWWCVALRAWGRFGIGRIPWAGIKFHWKIARGAAPALGSLRHLWFFFVSVFFFCCLPVSCLLSFKQLPMETGKWDRLLHNEIAETKTGCGEEDWACNSSFRTNW